MIYLVLVEMEAESNNRNLPILASVAANAIPSEETVYLGVNRGHITKCKEDLSILSTTDAKHDFGGKSSPEYIENAVKRFIPHWMTSRTYPSLSEETAFKLVVGEEIETVFRTILTNNNVGELNLVNPRRKYLTYGVTRESLKSGADLQNFLKKTTNAQNHIFSIDFDNQHLLELAKIGPVVPNANIFVVNSRETIADPAPKTIVDLKKNIKKYMGNTGIKLIQLHDSDPNNVSYTMFDDYQLDILNDFYSNLNIELAPIDRKTNNTKIIITSVDGGYSKVILNPKKEGSIASGIEKLVKFLSPKNAFDDQVQIVQKRAGDWLQALSCLQNTRPYTPLLPPEAPYILVTHDRVLLSYALYIGVNVIFLKAKHGDSPQSVVLFYNNIEQKKISFKTSLEQFWKINGPQRLEFAFQLRERLIAETNAKNQQESFILTQLLEAMIQAKAENKPNKFNTKCTDYIKTLLRNIIRKEKMESLNNTTTTIRQENTAEIIAQFSNITDENEEYLKNIQNFVTICEQNITQYGADINKATINAAKITDITIELEKRVRLESPQYLKKNNCKDADFTGRTPRHKPYISALLEFLQDNEAQATANLLSILNNNIQLGGGGYEEAKVLIEQLEYQNAHPDNYINYNYFSFADTEEDPTVSEIFINLYEYQFQSVQKLLSVKGANIELTYRFMAIVINDFIVKDDFIAEDDYLQYKNAVIREFTSIHPKNWIPYFSEKNNNSNPSRTSQLCMDCIEHFYTFNYLNSMRSVPNKRQTVKNHNPKELPTVNKLKLAHKNRTMKKFKRKRNAALSTKRQLSYLAPHNPFQEEEEYSPPHIPAGGNRTNKSNKLKKTRRRQRQPS